MLHPEHVSITDIPFEWQAFDEFSAKLCYYAIPSVNNSTTSITMQRRQFQNQNTTKHFTDGTIGSEQLLVDCDEC